MLSPIVVGCLSELNREENPKRSLADRYLRDAAEHVDCKEDADVLFALSEVLSMGYSERDDAYLPRFAMADGRRSFAMEDLDDDGVEILKEKVFRAHMLVYVTDRRNLDESIFLRLAYDKLRNQGYVSMDDLDFLVDRNAAIPDDRKEIIKRGLQLGVNGELYAAIHILLPQMENLIRELVKMCGDTVTFLREDGTEEFKPLSELLESRKLKESYDENFLFTLSTLLNERGGPNLRNENAHGFLSPIEGSSGAALCFLSLMIRFLSYYSRESIDILEKLLETE